MREFLDKKIPRLFMSAKAQPSDDVLRKLDPKTKMAYPPDV
jgi:hypothetical protein